MLVHAYILGNEIEWLFQMQTVCEQTEILEEPMDQDVVPEHMTRPKNTKSVSYY